MTQKIDPERLKEAAERLEWTLSQYPGDEVIDILRGSLENLIESAKNYQIRSPMDRWSIPQQYNFSDGVFSQYTDPSVDRAYCDLSVQLQGGLSENAEKIFALIKKIKMEAQT